MINVLVYAIADKYKILELKTLATHKFQSLSEDKAIPTGFTTIVNAIYNTTSHQGLRKEVVAVCAIDTDTFGESEEQFRMLQNIDDFGLNIVKALNSKFRKQRQDMKAKLQNWVLRLQHSLNIVTNDDDDNDDSYFKEQVNDCRIRIEAVIRDLRTTSCD